MRKEIPRYFIVWSSVGLALKRFWGMGARHMGVGSGGGGGKGDIDFHMRLIQPGAVLCTCYFYVSD